MLNGSVRRTAGLESYPPSFTFDVSVEQLKPARAIRRRVGVEVGGVQVSGVSGVPYIHLPNRKRPRI